MKYLIAGLGSIGRRHLRNLRALGETDIILYRTHQATLPDDDLAGLQVETDLRTALGCKPDGVIIANPTALHLEIALPAIEMGAAVLIEKPLSHSLECVEVLEETARRTGSPILVGFHFRFHPTLQKAAGLLASGEIGQVLSVRAQWGEYLPDWHPWEDHKQSYAARPDLGGGVILTLCHPLDYLRWMVGEVNTVWAFTAAHNLGLPVEDSAEIGLRFASRAIGSLQLNYNQRPGVHHLEIVGSQGSLLWDNADGSLRVFTTKGNAWENFSPPAGFERNVMFADEMRHFLAVTRHEVQPVCTLQDGIRALKLALAARESAETDRSIHIK